MMLIGRDLSPFVRRTAIVLYELGLPFERRIVASATDAEEITRSNPLGRVPALVADDDSVVIDSSAIIDYALELAGDDQQLLAPRGLLRRQTLFYSALMSVLGGPFGSSYPFSLILSHISPHASQAGHQ